tara:strand:- start:581 stop:1543 length:963 start_codon:yes stop_codon:yes gene_type:complete
MINKKEYPKFYLGPMSKNVVDAVIEFTEETDNKIGFIPSRRQVEYNGGYVNNWTTEEFSKYVNGRVLIERDHGGAGQGYVEDDGVKSFEVDSQYLDIIHVDPWKKYPKFDDGLKETLATINYIHNINPNTLFEVGTEEAIRKFTPDDLDKLLEELSHFEFFDNIKYAVVQSGVGLDLGKRVNTGNFDLDRLKAFIRVCKRWGKLSKEHNGDYLTNKDIKVRFDAGLDALNIAPEFGQLETLCYLEHMGDDIEDYYKICYNSKRWEKWVDDDFVPEDNKKELIKICGHYVFSDPKFLEIKPNIDLKIRDTIKNKLKELSNG